MNEKDIRIVKLEPMRVASAYAFGNSPEESALAKMGSFVEKKELLKEGHMPATFGFNNPNPSAGSPNYGYEVWLPVAESTLPADDVRIISFSGGLYAVAPCRGLQNITDDWLALAKWREGTEYAAGKHQWLEHLLSPPGAPLDEMTFDLYLPIAEQGASYRTRTSTGKTGQRARNPQSCVSNLCPREKKCRVSRLSIRDMEGPNWSILYQLMG